MIILKKCAALIMAFLLLACVAGCAGSDADIKPATLTKEILTYVDDDIKWVSLKKNEIKGYFGFSGEELKSHSAYINDSEEKYDIVAAFEFKNIESLRSAVEKVNASLNVATQNFAAAIDSEREKITNHLIVSKDNVLVVVVSSNAPKIKEMLKDKGFSVVE